MNRTNLLIDIMILAAFLVVMDPFFTGIAVHEWLSLALAGTVIVHLLLHWKWITSVGASFFKNLWHSSRLKFAVDLLLFITFTAMMMSGIMISRAVLPALGIQIEISRTWRVLHSLLAEFSMLLVGLHFALNWKWVTAMFKRYLAGPAAGLFKRSRSPEAVSETAGD